VTNRDAAERLFGLAIDEYRIDGKSGLDRGFQVDVVFQLLKPAIDEDVVDERPHDFSVGFCLSKVGCFGRSIDHGMTGGVGPLSRLDIVPVLDGLTLLESEDFKADPRAGEIVFGVGEDVVAILECADDIDPRIAPRQSLKKRS
jgi:hypothetical protein